MKKIVWGILVVSLLLLGVWKLDLQGAKRGDGCLFCRQELLDVQRFLETEGAYGILTYKPAVPGHVLIIPKRHVERFEDLSKEEMADLGEAIQRVDRAVRAVFGNKDYALIQKNGPLAGQTVPHLHFHYLPGGKFIGLRYLISPLFKPLSTGELTDLQTLLSEAQWN